MGALLGAVLGLVPLVILPGVLFYFDVTPKVFVLAAAVALILPWFAVTGRFSALAGFREGRWLGIALVANLVSLSVSTALSENPALSVGGTNWRRLGLVAYAAVLLFAAITAAHCQ